MNTRQAKSTSRTLAAFGTVGGWTMASRLLGFVRDVLLARVLGAGMLADAFFVAFKLPNFFRRLFAEGTLTVALVPVLAEQRRKGEAAAHDFLNALAGLLLTALIAFTVLGMIFMPILLLTFAPGFYDEPERWDQTLMLARWMFPYLTMISLTAMGWAVLNCYRRFAIAAASPALLNISLIFAAVVLAPGFANPALAMAVGVLMGGALQLSIQFPALKRIGWVPKPRLKMLPAVKQTLRLLGPAVLGVAAVQVNILVGTILATMLPVGAVSYMYYADRLVQLPLALFGIAMGTALLPALADHFSAERKESAIAELKQGLAWLTWITLPATFGLLLLAEPIVTALFEHGRFAHADSIATAQTLQAFALGLLPFCWARVLATACYAEKDSKTPMRFAAIGVAVNIALALVLMWPLAWVGLALATSLGAVAQSGLLYMHLKRRHGPLIDAGSSKRMMSAVIACIPMGIWLWSLPMLWPMPAAKIGQLAWLALAVAVGIVLFFACAWLFGERGLVNALRQDASSGA